MNYRDTFNNCCAFALNKFGKDQKCSDDIAVGLAHAIAISGVSFSDFVVDYTDSKIINPEIFDVGGSIDSFINPKYKAFYHALKYRRPIGLGTPNAACGSHELFFALSSPDIKKCRNSGCGDLQIGSKNVEIKSGLDFRFISETSGKAFYRHVSSLAEKFGIKCQDFKFWNFDPLERVDIVIAINKLGFTKMLDFISLAFDLDGFNFTRQNAVACFNQYGIFQPKLLQKQILLALSLTRLSKVDKLVFIRNDLVKTYNVAENAIQLAIESGEISPSVNYFRIFQNFSIGWYFEIRGLDAE